MMDGHAKAMESLKRLERAYALITGDDESTADHIAALQMLDEARGSQNALPRDLSDAHARAAGHLRNAIGFHERHSEQSQQLLRAQQMLDKLRDALGEGPSEDMATGLHRTTDLAAKSD